MNHKRPSRSELWLATLLLLGMFALYLHQLDGASLWRDEALSVVRAEQSLGQIFANRNIVQGIPSPDLHPPFYFLILHLWQGATGGTEFAYRLPSAFFMLLALAGFYHIGRLIWGRQTAVFTLLLVIFSPFFYWYAREARMYALVVLETVIFYRLLWPLLQPDTQWWHFALLGLASLLLVATHYTGIFVLAFALAVWLLLLLQKRPNGNWWFIGLIILLVGGVALAPHLLELLSLPEFFAFSQRQLWVLAQEGINTFSLGSAGPMEGAQWQLLPFILLGIVGMATTGFAQKQERWRIFLLGTGGVLLTLLAFFAASWLKANYSNPRHLTVLAVPWFLLMGYGLTTIWRWQRALATMLGLLAIGLSGQQLWQTIQAPPIMKDDVRALATYIEARQQPGDLVLWHDAIMMTTYDYYAPALPYTAVPSFGTSDPTVILQKLEQLHETYERIWFVSSPSPSYFDPKLIPDWLAARRFRADTALFPASWASLHLTLLERADTVIQLPSEAVITDLNQASYQLHAIALEERYSAEGVWASLYWQATSTETPPPAACMRLQDSNQVIWSEGCANLVLPAGMTPTNEGYYQQQLWLPLSPGLPPITYDLALSLEAPFAVVGSLQVPAWEAEPPQSNLAHYANTELQLISLNWQAEEFRAGLWALGNLLWYAEEEPMGATAVRLRLIDFWGQVIAEQTTPLGPNSYPAEQWSAENYGQTPVSLPLPFSADGHYRLQVQLIHGDTILKSNNFGAGDWVTAGWVNVVSWPMVTTLPAEATPLTDITFAGIISLTGYQINRADEKLTVDLFWQSSATLEKNYGVFVHVGQANSAPIAQSSNGPANWLRPTSSWRIGEIVRDSHELTLPPAASVENLSILVGWYDLENPQNRLPLTILGRFDPSNSYLLQPLPPAGK